jgi:hypothetical protein
LNIIESVDSIYIFSFDKPISIHIWTSENLLSMNDLNEYITTNTEKIYNSFSIKIITNDNIYKIKKNAFINSKNHIYYRDFYEL